jgi:hypothetical protein
MRRAIGELKLPRLARSYPASVVRAAAKSIEELGLHIPLLIERDGTLISGEIWFLAAQRLELYDLPVIEVSDRSPAHLNAYRIAVQRLPELGTWDSKILAHTLLELSHAIPDLSLEVTGFSVPEIDLLIQNLDVPTGGADPADELPAGGPPIAQIGDIYLLGHHRLLCGDAEVPNSYDQLMNGELAHAVFTDVPYNRAGRDISGKGKTGVRSFKMASGEMSPARYGSFLRGCIGLMAAHSVDGSLHYHCIDWRHLQDIQAAADTIYCEHINTCVWEKLNAGMGSLYRSQHEFIAVFRYGKNRHRNNVELGRHGRNRSNIWRYAGGTSFSGRITEEGNLLNLHPTVKPVQMVADAILDCTARGDIVLDPFLGSGSTLIASERTGRRCFGMELDPQYVDVAIRRWQHHTGGHAIHALTGRRFDEMEPDPHG